MRRIKRTFDDHGVRIRTRGMRREFEEKSFEALCKIQCTQKEILAVLHTDIRILNKWCLKTYGEDYNTLYERFRQGGKASVRRIQFQLAEKNASMAIWLGKQMLDQKDTIHQETTVKSDNVHIYIPDNGRETEELELQEKEENDS